MLKVAGRWFSIFLVLFLAMGFLGTPTVEATGKHGKSYGKIVKVKNKVHQKFHDLHDDDDDGYGHPSKHRKPRVDQANKAGDIRGAFHRCNGDSSGIFVYVVGRSFSALLAPDGHFTLSYVPPGTYTLAFVKENHVLTTVDGIQVKKHKVTLLGDLDYCPDNDNDGFDESQDCNDNNPNIYPGSAELCDGLDNNCDGEVDEGCPECTDGDNDGFFAQNGCGSAVDCDDNDPTVNPNSLEVCDGTDNNCDGQTDEGCPLNCPTGTADCNNDRVDCETDLSNDSSNCGGCGTACGSGQVCVNSSCESGQACTDQEIGALQSCLGACGGGLTCTSQCLASVSSTCGSAVQLLGLCASSSGCLVNAASDLLTQCVSQSCPTQWEAAFGDLQPGCPSGQTQCGGQCVDLNSSTSNCGACNNTCGQGQVCSAGACQNDPNSCVPGTPCNADSNGCTQQDVCDNTGTCVAGPPVVCADDGNSCTQSVCQSNGSSSFTCQLFNSQNGSLCENNGTCQDGLCQSGCSPTETQCGGTCVDTNSDPNNCGSCNVACPASAPVCSNGACTTAPPVDCQVSAWSAWSACSAACGGGTQTRTRTVTVPPSNGGAACPSLTESRACNTQACPDACVGVPLTQACGQNGPGVCSPGTQTRTCDPVNGPGPWGACIGGINPSPEVCDGLDNNCDGQTDEGNPGGGSSCNTGLAGVCAQGALACTGGALTCQQTVAPSTDICGDNLDNDCDGQVDEDCQTACPNNCSNNGICIAGVCNCFPGSTGIDCSVPGF